jgi:predicted dehydrogenase
MWLNGPIERVVAKTKTFVTERTHAVTGKKEPVGIDDACMFLAEFQNGSIGTFESTRYARGRKNFNTFEMNGAEGSLYFDLEEPEYLQFFEYKQLQSGKKTESHLTGWRKIHTTNGEHPYMSHYWVPGTCIGYEHTFLNALADFVEGIESGKPTQPDFRNALQTQKVCDAVLESAKSGKWEDTAVAHQR